VFNRFRIYRETLSRFRAPLQRQLISEFSPGISDRKIGHIYDYVDRTVGKAEIWVEVKIRNPDMTYDKVKDSLLFLAKERARERAVQESKESG
jgi:hypothetical protein